MSIHSPESKPYDATALFNTFRSASHTQPATPGHLAEYAHLLDAAGDQYHNIAPGAPTTLATIRRDIRADYHRAAMDAHREGDPITAYRLHRQLADIETAWHTRD